MSDTIANRQGEAPRILSMGDQALTVEFGDSIDPVLNNRVLALYALLQKAEVAGVIDLIPTYRSVSVYYDPLRIESAPLIETIRGLIDHAGDAPAAESRRWTIPVAYGGEHGMDLAFVAEVHGLTPERVVELHSGAEYRVYMIGFAPGFTYLGGLPEELHTPRRDSPRLLTPAQSVSLGGVQAAVSSVAVPSGWHMLGRTPVRTFDLRRDDPILFRPGDMIRFTPISTEDFDALDRRAEAGDRLVEPHLGA